jgi:hypothetical protein
MGALTLSQAREIAANRSKQLSEFRSKAHVSAATGGAVTLAGTFTAGFVDERFGAIGGMRPSAGAGIAIGLGGLFMKSPKMVNAATGLLAPTVYDAGRQAAQRMAGGSSS